jgi:hypothetical protein
MSRFERNMNVDIEIIKYHDSRSAGEHDIKPGAQIFKE